MTAARKKPKKIVLTLTDPLKKKIDETRTLRDRLLGEESGYFDDEELLMQGLAKLQDWYPELAKKQRHRPTTGTGQAGLLDMVDFAGLEVSKAEELPKDPEAPEPCTGPEIPGVCEVCRECDVLTDCLRKDPYAGCRDTVLAIDKAAKEKEQDQKPVEKTSKGKPAYSILIEPASNWAHQKLADMGYKYRLSLSKNRGESNGLGTPCKDKEDVCRWVFKYLMEWLSSPDTPKLITSGKGCNLEYVDESGDFSLEDFLNEDGTAKPVPVEETKTEKKKRTVKGPGEKKTRFPARKSKKPADAAPDPNDHWCANCAGYAEGGIITRKCPKFAEVMRGDVPVESVMMQARKEPCASWTSREETKPDLCENCSILDCTVFDPNSPECRVLHPGEMHEAEKSPVQTKAGGPTPGTCGTCGHHKGRKTFHESCPRLGELVFKGGTKSAKVLMQETERERCGYWSENPPVQGLDYTPFNLWQMKNCAGCTAPNPCELRRHRLSEFENGRGLDPKYECPEKKKPEPEEHEDEKETGPIECPRRCNACRELPCPNRGEPERGCNARHDFARAINEIRCSCPGWYWEVWRRVLKTGEEELVDGDNTEKKAKETAKRHAEKSGKKWCEYVVRKRPSSCDLVMSMSCTSDNVAACIASGKIWKAAVCTASGEGTEAWKQKQKAEKKSASKKSKTPKKEEPES